jgi:hypothetical protein
MEYRETACSNACSTAHSAASVAGVAVSYAEHWAGWPGKQLYGAVGTCTVLSMLLPTGLIYISHWHRQSSTINRQKCCRQQGNQPQSTCNVCSTSCVALCMELTMTLAYGCTEESVCLSGAGRQHSNPHARRRLDARGAGLSVSEELAMLGSHSQLAETQCMIQLYLQQQSSATC